MTNSNISKVINVKEKQTEELKRQLKVKKSELRQNKEELKNLNKELDALQGVIQNEVYSSNAELYFQYLHTLGKKIDNKEKEVEIKNKEVKESEENLLNSYRESKVLNILKDDLLKKELKKTILNEQKNFDFDFLTRKLRK